MSDYHRLNIHQRINYKGNQIRNMGCVLPLFSRSKYDFENKTVAIGDWCVDHLFIQHQGRFYERPACFDGKLYGQEEKRLSEFNAGDTVLRVYCGHEFLIAETNRLYYVLENKTTGRHSEWNADANGGFVLVKKAEPKREVKEQQLQLF